MASTIPPRRPDQSMSLLSEVVATAQDPGYRQAATDRPGHPRGGRGAMVLLTLLVAGTMLGMAIIQRAHEAPQAARERAALIAQVKAQQADHERLRADLVTSRAEVERWQREALGSSAGSEQLGRLQLQAGASAMSGPGLRIVVNDSNTLSGRDAEVLDQDLRQLVNGLWAAGAEAIAINGHRITSRTAIRGAGKAITVDYTSLTRPYQVEAIGDPKTLVARWAATSGAQWWNHLKANYGMRYDLSSAERITVPGDPRLQLRKAGPTK